MSDMYLLLILLLAIGLPPTWFVSEFSNYRWLRLLLGCSAIGISFLIAYGVGSLEHLNANVWYGNASQNLVDVTVEEIEKGNGEQVVRELKELQKSFQPSYENRGRYDKLVEQYLERLGHKMEQHAMMPPNPPKP
jgi:hypothetical protein